MTLDAELVRKDFPIFKILMNGKPLVYLDSAATSQKPKKVIDAISGYYRRYNANIHRGVYKISEKATTEYEKSKKKVASLIGTKDIGEMIYTRNTTESINLVALTWAEQNLKSGDHVLISELEHHSNIVPWIMLSKKKGIVLDYIKLNQQHNDIDYGSLEQELAKNPKLVSISHCSNVLGTIIDVKKIVRMAHEKGAIVLIDGAQSVPHMEVDVKDIDCDFMAFSSHKMLGPSGVGVLYGKRALLEGMPPALGGGDMILTVSHYDFTPNDLPWKFEAGTSNIEGGIGLGVAASYLKKLGMAEVREHEKRLTKYALEQLEGLDRVTVFGYGSGDIDRRGGIISFDVDGVHPHDVAEIFDSEGIAIRAGHHCAMPLVVEILKKPAVSRMSFYVYNTEADVEKAVAAIKKTKEVFKHNV
jgi:cysteine desulfurase/selenocysteine lyase